MKYTGQDLTTVKVYQLAQMIEEDWAKVNFAARPYLDAMLTLGDISDRYIMDDGKGIVAYFLNNATTWRGATARAIKSELRSRL